MTRTLETERLLLRPYRASDAVTVAEQIGEFAVSQWLTRVPHPYGEADALAFFDKVASEAMVYAVCRSDELVGCVSIMGDLGYWYGANHWGRGYATEAARAVVNAHFAHSDAPIESGYIAGNEASRNVLKKIGFVSNGFKETPCLSRKANVTINRVILSREMWEGDA
ncbi:MAG: GNAT family N-acetyltransferase [Tateyamaria sp.]|uniref:GNAT family N-acetyltransferase n=1 Tax=Tateyamaria sp. TaxID=1929288 RepID=UPI00329ED5F0